MTKPLQAAAQLVERVPVIVKNSSEHYQKTGAAYNIFKVAGINEREVIMCRVLADLLNPKGLHRRGSAYLELFMDMVVNPLIKNTAQFNPIKAKITTEFKINEDRRIDIVLDDGAVFIPIEVKINTVEQEHQLADYAAVSRKNNTIAGFIPVLFLTPYGHESNEASKDDYIPISFKKHIIPWLDKCRNLEETDRVSPVREMIKQFLSAIKSFCGYTEDKGMENAINTLITESRNSYVSALMIHQAVEELDFNKKVWEIFRDQICEHVKNKFYDAKYLEDGEGVDAWYCLDIPIGNECKLRINYDWIITVEPVNPNKTINTGIAEKIKKTMSGITGVHNEDCGEGSVWFSSNIKFPGIENTGNDRIYKYELYQIYSKNPQSVADRIISIVMGLKNI